MPDGEMEAASVEMPKYVSHKEVWALQIERVEWNTPNSDPDPAQHRFRITFRDGRYAPILSDPGLFSKYEAEPDDYFVVYKDGYKSISPRAAFEEGYTRI